MIFSSSQLLSGYFFRVDTTPRITIPLLSTPFWILLGTDPAKLDNNIRLISQLLSGYFDIIDSIAPILR
jgi:hypothetical protein